jgi:SsrA-binding protein
MKKLSIKNKKAFFNYEIIESEIAGLVLLGTEVKSILEGKISFTDAYCDFVDNELWLKNFHISEYENASAETHDPKRNRKLLLTKQQLNKFKKKFDEKGLTVVPLNIFINNRGLVKMDIALVRGKKQYDKKNSIAEREEKIKIKRDFNINI